MTTIASLRVKLEANTRAFRRGISEATESVKRFSIRATAAATAAGVAMSAVFAQAVKDADNLNNLAIRLGTTTKALSELRFVASQSGIDFNVFSTALQRMVRRISEAAETGKGEAAPALEALGLEAKALAALKPDKQFEAIAEAMKQLGNQGERVRLAMKLFDTEGVSLVQTMTKGARGIKAARREARLLGITLSGNTAKVAQKVAAAWDKLTSTIAAALRNLALKAAPKVLVALRFLQGEINSVLRGTNETFNNFIGETQALFELIGMVFKRTAAGEYKSAADLIFKIVQSLGRKLAVEVNNIAGLMRELIGPDVFDGWIAAVEFFKGALSIIKRTLQSIGTIIGGTAAVVGETLRGNFSGTTVINQQVWRDLARIWESRDPTDGNEQDRDLLRANETQVEELRRIGNTITNIGVLQ